MPESNPQPTKKAADLVAKLAMVAEIGPVSFTFIVVSDENLVVFHQEISGYDTSWSELDSLIGHGFVEVSYYPAGPYPSHEVNEEESDIYTGRFSITQQGLVFGRRLSRQATQGTTTLRILHPTRQQAGPIEEAVFNTGTTATTSESGFPTPDQLLASAAKYLIEGRDEEAASALLSCRIEQINDYGPPTGIVDIGLRGPRPAQELLSMSPRERHYQNSVAQRVKFALAAVLPPGTQLGDVDVRAELVELNPEWKAELIAQARGKAVNNQATNAPNFRLWNHLRFRSATEVKIADALDRAGVMFFPLCKARLTQGSRRVNREPDFLVCHRGKWGILEVDGEPWHPKGRAAEDHARDRLFKAHGLTVVEHYDAKPCYEIPDVVVKNFLSILENST